MACGAGPGEGLDGRESFHRQKYQLGIYCKSPVVLGLALKDKNKNQYVAQTPSTKGGRMGDGYRPDGFLQAGPLLHASRRDQGSPKGFQRGYDFQYPTPNGWNLSVAVNNIVAQ